MVVGISLYSCSHNNHHQKREAASVSDYSRAEFKVCGELFYGNGRSELSDYNVFHIKYRKESLRFELSSSYLDKKNLRILDDHLAYAESEKMLPYICVRGQFVSALTGPGTDDQVYVPLKNIKVYKRGRKLLDPNEENEGTAEITAEVSRP